jgi:outer membrane protein assembly factor BamA
MGPLQAFTYGRTERVRGHRQFAPGRQMMFGSVEYRVPLVPSLQTQVLGLVRFGGLSASVFADAGVVWRTLGTNATDRRTGVGAELRSVIALPGLNAGIAVGVAQKGQDVFGETYETYVRIRTAVPF